MSKTSEYLKENQENLDLYTTAITRAHGEHHPEVFKVKKIYQAIWDKLEGDSEADVKPEFAELRHITKDYAIPGDVCQTFTATYQMLEQADHLNH